MSYKRVRAGIEDFWKRLEPPLAAAIFSNALNFCGSPIAALVRSP
jgi:hypothetical protein